MAMDRARSRLGAGAGYDEAIDARRGMDRRPAEQERRLGRLRRRQHLPLPQQHPLRRPRRPARSADGRRHRPLRLACWPSWARPSDSPRMARALAYLEKEQEADGSWFGRWGVNYIYGTWSALCALNAAGVDRAGAGGAQGGATGWWRSRTPTAAGARTATAMRWTTRATSPSPPTASQTAWALLGLMAAGRGRPSGRGARHRLSDGDTRARTASGTEDAYTGGGFPRVFYLRYHGYPKFFPLWALARYRNLKRANDRQVALRHVMILVATGLRREAKHPRRARACWSSPAAATRRGWRRELEAARCADADADASASACAAALAPDLKPGDWVVAASSVQPARPPSDEPNESSSLDRGVVR